MNDILFCIAALPTLTQSQETPLYIDFSVTPSTKCGFNNQWSGTCFTIGLWPHDPKLVKLHIAHMWKTISRAGHNFAHAMAAKLPWHVQSYDLIGSFTWLDDFNFKFINHFRNGFSKLCTVWPLRHTQGFVVARLMIHMIHLLIFWSDHSLDWMISIEWPVGHSSS